MCLTDEVCKLMFYEIPLVAVYIHTCSFIEWFDLPTCYEILALGIIINKD